MTDKTAKLDTVKKKRDEKRKSDFKYQRDANRDSHLSHRSYRSRGSPYDSNRDTRGFGKDPAGKRRSH